jgi:hypothetical protein
MPGLIGGIARTAVVAGTATAVSGRVQRRQSERFADRDAHIYAERQQAYAQQQQQLAAQPQYAQPQPVYAPPPAPAPAPAVDPMVAQIEQLAALRDQGILTEEEFSAKKAQVLGI